MIRKESPWLKPGPYNGDWEGGPLIRVGGRPRFPAYTVCSIFMRKLFDVPRSHVTTLDFFGHRIDKRAQSRIKLVITDSPSAEGYPISLGKGCVPVVKLQLKNGTNHYAPVTARCRVWVEIALEKFPNQRGFLHCELEEWVAS